MKTTVLPLLLLLCAASPLFAQTDDPVETRIYQTKRLPNGSPILDGHVDDPQWEAVDWSGDFIQRDPTDGDPPSQPTEFKVLYDDDALYFAIRAHDDPEQVTSMLARRDWFPGDWVEVNIDSYGDNRTAFSFTLSLSGTRGDEFISNDGSNWDGSWDPVWAGATQMDNQGWTAEMRIPLSQLRFSSEELQTWGLQVQRRLYREEERSTWQRIPKDTTGWVSQFGELRGIQGLKPSQRVELMPYAVTKAESFEKIEGDPFQDGSRSALTGGLDGKIGVASDLTLDFTINPDFGQVEADPSEVNLTAFETYFSERRPFFVEGNNIFQFRLAPAITGGHFAQDDLFYSRRIGKRPSYWPDLTDDESLDQPDNTSILGAFKLSGKTAGGTSIGVLECVTAEERAEIDLAGNRRQKTVEPRTNYFVGRVQQDFREGDTQLGAMVTMVHRNIKDEHLDYLRRQAYAGGVDFSHYFLDRNFRVDANVLASHLKGSAEAIYEVQTSPAHYYQRPDNDHVNLDPDATTLNGYAASVRVRRTSNNSSLRCEMNNAWRSAGFEINDLGYMRR
ncbi:MAG: DUF5916 domain-containing protein, partial [bacterium]